MLKSLIHVSSEQIKTSYKLRSSAFFESKYHHFSQEIEKDLFISGADFSFRHSIYTQSFQGKSVIKREKRVRVKEYSPEIFQNIRSLDGLTSEIINQYNLFLNFSMALDPLIS